MRFSHLALNAIALLVVTTTLSGNSNTLSLVYAEEVQTEEAPVVVEEAATPTGEGEAAAAATEEAAASTTQEKKEEVKEEAVPYTPPENAETFSFQAEVNRMLDIVVHSLYQHKDVFLRELISNASDALDKIRYLLLTEPDKYKTEGEEIPLEVQIEFDSDAKTIVLRDTGVGMTKDDLIMNLGTVARSGTTKFLEALKASGSDTNAVSQIGQFGVGFYSAFLVSDRITVASKNPLDPVQHVWESVSGSEDFVIYPDPRGNTMARGTEITLHLKEDCLEFADAARIEELAKHYSEFITHPISLRKVKVIEVPVDDDEDKPAADDEEKKEGDEEDDLEVKEDEEKDDDAEVVVKTKEVTTYEWELVNGNPALWTRDKDEITDEEYINFYHSLIGDDTTNATEWSHFTAEGNINFKSLLYLPEEVPPGVRIGFTDAKKSLIRLYVRRVLISDQFELLPQYLSFIQGVVDSDDLPLNVNRETLQESKILQIIKKKLVRKALEMIKALAKESETKEESEGSDDEEKEKDEDKADDDEEESKYDIWYKSFSPYLKTGAIDDEPNRSKLMKLLRFPTSKSNGKFISLDQYVKNMKEWQDDIYVLGGMSIEEMEKSPFLEVFREKDLEVVFLVDPVDEYLIQHVRDFERKKFVQVTAENVKFKDEDEDLIKRREKVYKEKFAPLTKWLRKLFNKTVLRVQVAKRPLGSVPAVVTSSDFGNSANMERILRAQAYQAGMDYNSIKAMRIFELNPRHPLVLKLLEGAPPEKEGDEPFVVAQETIDAAWTLHDMAMLNGGFPLPDPEATNKRLLKVLQTQYSLDSLALEPEIDPPKEEEEDDDAPEFDMDAMGLNMEDFDGIDLESLDLDEEAPNDEL